MSEGGGSIGRGWVLLRLMTRWGNGQLNLMPLSRSVIIIRYFHISTVDGSHKMLIVSMAIQNQLVMD